MESAGRVIDEVRPAGAVPARHPLWTVQVLRGAAALMVVAGHAQSAVAILVRDSGGHFARSTAVPWGAGVDLFFVISGFIIVHASRSLFGRPDAVRSFLWRRLARIVPLYWLATTLFVALLAAASLKGGVPLPGVGRIAASYLFVPADTTGDGRLFPVFDLGWTLNYEMFFYALLAAVIGLPRRRALPALAVLLAALVLLGAGLNGPSAPWFWTRPIIIDFGWGVAVGALYGSGHRWPAPLRIALAIGGTAMLLADPGHLFDRGAGLTVANAWPRVLLAGLPVAVVIAAAVMGPEPRMPRLAMPFTNIGDASYSLYLLHPFVLIAIEKLAQKVPVMRLVPGWALVLAAVTLGVAVALAGYRWIERPITAAIARRIPTTPRRHDAPAAV